MKYIFDNENWKNINIIDENTSPTRPFYCGYRSYEEAKKGSRLNSNNFILLNGSWLFEYFKSPYLVPKNCMNYNYCEDSCVEMIVPAHWQLNGFDKPVYNDCYAMFPITDEPIIQADNPSGLYRKKFHINLEDRKYILRLDGVESAYSIWLNEKYVGYAQESRNTHEFDISNILVDGDNLITIVVYKYCDGSYLENQDMWWLSGIIRDVSIIVATKKHVIDYKIETSFTDNVGIKDIIGKKVEAILNIDVDINAIITDNIKIKFELWDEESLIDKEEIKALNVSKDKFKVCYKKTLNNIIPWSSELAKLYTLVMQLVINDETIEYYSDKIGFRQIELKDGLVYINKRPIKFKGVNRHDWNEETGRCITREDMLKDLYLMKRHNINAIRTSHYPPSPDFLELCDEMGFYVMEEADIECNQMTYTKNMNKISDDVRFENSYVHRVLGMVQRDKNHPCVISWSLGNESGFGTNFVSAARKAKQLDNTRFIHYEEDRDASIADVYSTMYTRHKELDIIGRDTSKNKPHIVCEYAHAMGNGPGGLKEYWEIFNAHKRLQGGFIWEWADHGIKKIDDNGVKYYTYGGDYDDYPNSGAFCCDGLVQADKTPTPAMKQVKKVFEPIKFTDFNIDEGSIVVNNNYDFISLENCICKINIKAEEIILLEKELELPLINANEKQKLQLFNGDILNKIQEINDKEVVLSIVVFYKNKPVWDDNTGICFHQEILKDKRGELAKINILGKLQVKDEAAQLIINGDDFELVFDKLHAQILTYKFKNELIIKKGLCMNFYRAPVDNDKNVDQLWQKSMLRAMRDVVHSIEVLENENNIVIEAKQTYAPIVMDWKILINAKYVVYTDGTVDITYSGIPTGRQLPQSLPRIGLRFLLHETFDEVIWYGLGDSETYKDCKEGNLISVWEKKVKDMYFPYVVPQETGNHEDTRWLEIKGNTMRLRIDSNKHFGFSALHYMQEDLVKSTHINELTKIKDVQLCIDYAQHGLGSASWGAECLDKDVLACEPFEMMFRFSVYQK